MDRKEFNFPNTSQQLFKMLTYQVCIICDDDETQKELGTGFLFMRKDWIVTAAHVVCSDGIKRENLFAQFTTQDGNNIKLKVIAVHNENDIALLQIVSEYNPCSHPLYPGYDELSISRGLVCCGYTPSKGKKITVSLAKAYNKDYRHRSETETIIEFNTNDVEGGSSGGPIFGDGGVVVGIMINLVSIEGETNKKFARATSIQNLTKAILIEFDKNIMIPSNNQDYCP